MSAQHQHPSKADRSNLTPRPSDGTIPATSHQCTTAYLICDGEPHHHAVSTAARPELLSPHDAGQPLRHLKPNARLRVAIPRPTQILEARLDLNQDLGPNFLDGVGSWSGSTCGGSLSEWSTTTCVPAAEDWAKSASETDDGEEGRILPDHRSSNEVTSGALQASRMDTLKKPNAYAQAFHETYWRKQISEPWSPEKLRSESPSYLNILDHMVRGYLSDAASIRLPQRDRPGSTWNPILLPVLGRDQGNQSTPMSETLLKLLPVLDPQTNPGRANDFFNGLDILLGDLRDRFPNDNVVLGLIRALERLELFYQLNLVEPSTSFNQWLEATNNTEGSTEGSAAKDGSLPTRNVSLQTPTADHPGEHFGDSNHLLDDQQSGRGPGTGKRRRVHTQNGGRRLACPIRRHQEFHNQPHSCGFPGACYMWEVAKHLKKPVHHRFLPFIVLCRHCWIYVTDEDKYRDIHRRNQCDVSSQPRGRQVPEHWGKLYRSIYPRSNTTPSPWISDCQEGDPTLAGPRNRATTPGSLTPVVAQSHSIAFLGDEPRSSGIQIQPPQAFNASASSSTAQQAEEAALHLFSSMFEDSFRRPGDLGDHYMNQLVVGQASHLPPEQIQQFADRFRDRASQIVGMLQSQAENNTPRENSCSNLPSRHPTSTVVASAVAEPLQSQSWLGQFPVPEEMLADPFELAAPLQQDSSPDLFNIGDWIVDELPDQASPSPSWSSPSRTITLV